MLKQLLKFIGCVVAAAGNLFLMFFCVIKAVNQSTEMYITSPCVMDAAISGFVFFTFAMMWSWLAKIVAGE